MKMNIMKAIEGDGRSMSDDLLDEYPGWSQKCTELTLLLPEKREIVYADVPPLLRR